MNDVQNVGDHLRVSDDISDGRYRVPVVFGQPYSRARRILHSSGWVARPSTDETFEGDRTEGYRTQFPEVDSCSGTGYAYCSFSLSARDGVASLFIMTAGEDADPVVTNYEVSCAARQDQ